MLMSGLVPALRAMRTAPASSLRQAGGTSETRPRPIWKEPGGGTVALSVVLLSAAGLFVRHLLNLRHLDLGFHPDHVLLVTLDPKGSGYDDEHLSLTYQQLLERLEATGCYVRGYAPPIFFGCRNEWRRQRGGLSRQDREKSATSWKAGWAPKYFATLGTELLTGRDFSFQDKGGPRVAIINQTMARYYFGKDDPIGKHVSFDGDGQPYEIVGVAGDAKYMEVGEAMYRTIYLNTFQAPPVDSRFALRFVFFRFGGSLF